VNAVDGQDGKTAWELADEVKDASKKAEEEAKKKAETKRKEEAAAKQKAAAEAKVATPHSALLDPQRQQRFRGSLTVYMYLCTYTYMYMYVDIC